MKRKAFTLIEVMVAAIVLVLLLTSLWRVFSSTQRNAKVVMENHAINDALDRTLIKITDDVREANSIDDEYPPLYEESALEGLKTEDEKNQLKFIKVDYKFHIDPSTLDSNKVNYTANQIVYRLEKEVEPTATENSKWVMIREMTPLNENKEPVTSEMTVHTVLSGIDECIFYRVKDPETSRSGNIFIKLRIGEKKDKYSNESIISIKERGAMPES